MSDVLPARANVILCANCGIVLRPGAARTVLNLPEEVRHLLPEWIDRKVLETDKICKNCDHALNQSVKDKDRKRKVPHSKLCSGCGKSVLRDRYRTYKPDDPMAIAVLSWHPLLQPKEEIYVCRACNRHLEKKIANQNKQSNEKNKLVNKDISEQMYVNEASDNDDDYKPENDPESEKDIDRASRLNKRHEMLLQQECLTTPEVENSEKLILRNYKRLPSNAKQCIFKKCTQKKWQTLPKYVKEILLIDYNIYASNKTRICSYHLQNGDWKMLLENKLLKKFSAIDIEDALEILKKPRENPVDFDDVESMSNNLCQFLTGMTTKDFINLHDSVKWNLSQSRKALAVLLIKVRSKDSFEKIAPLLGIGYVTAKRYFYIASECLKQADCRKKIVSNPDKENGSDEQKGSNEENGSDQENGSDEQSGSDEQNCKSDDDELPSDGEQ